MNKIIILIFCMALISGCAKKVTTQQSTKGDQSASSLNPEDNRQPQQMQRNNASSERFLFFFKKKKKVNWADQLVVEYQERMKDNAKAAKKKAKEMEKPQYSDPSYFGHKRKPKKRPPHKMKFCEECGIRH